MDKELGGDLKLESYVKIIQQVLPEGSMNTLLGKAASRFDQISKALKEGNLSNLARKIF